MAIMAWTKKDHSSDYALMQFKETFTGEIKIMKLKKKIVNFLMQLYLLVCHLEVYMIARNLTFDIEFSHCHENN